MAGVDLAGLPFVHIKPGDIESLPRELDGQGQADVAKPDHPDFRLFRANPFEELLVILIRGHECDGRRPGCLVPYRTEARAGAGVDASIAMSASTIISTSCLKLTAGVQPSSLRAFVGSPSR